VLHLASKLAVDVDVATDALLDYPGATLRYYDFGPPSPPNEVTPTDVGRLLVIEPLNQRVAVPILSASNSAPWERVDPDARLIDADPEGPLYAAANALYEHFERISGVGPAIASKLLHLKRPAFFPLLDSELRALYDQAAQEAYQRSEVWKIRHPEWRRLYWAAVREDLLNSRNQEALAAVRSRLRDGNSDLVHVLLQASDVRLLDIVSWTLSIRNRRQSGDNKTDGN